MHRQGRLKVSVCPGAPLDEERLAELAFEGKLPPAPLGFVNVPVADLAGLERRWVVITFLWNVEKTLADFFFKYTCNHRKSVLVRDKLIRDVLN